VADPDLVYTGVFTGLALALVIAVALPAPPQPVHNEAGAQMTLLGLGCAAVTVTGILALLGHPAASALFGAIAWLVVMPCLWMARAPRPADGGLDDDDDGGGSPWPRVPSAPPAPPDGLPGMPGLPPAAVGSSPPAWAPAPAPSPVPVTAAAQLPAVAAATPPVEHRRLQPRPRPVRGDHRSIAHVRAGAAVRTRPSVGRRLLRHCRRLLWIEPPERVTYLHPSPPSHDARRHASPGGDARSSSVR
jgi:hypothetical protein